MKARAMAFNTAIMRTLYAPVARKELEMKNRNPIAKAVTRIRPQVIKAKKGRGSYQRRKARGADLS
jgi:hypothetical protein